MRAVGHDTGGDPLALGAVDPGYMWSIAAFAAGGEAPRARLDGGTTLGDGGAVVAGQYSSSTSSVAGLPATFTKTSGTGRPVVTPRRRP